MNPTTTNPATTNTGFTPIPDEQTSTAGTPIAKIATKQIAITKEDLEKFGIEETYAKENPALIDLILKTESMKDEERKYWFQLLPIMSTEQVKKLQNILQNEKDQLTELDKKYESEVAKLNANNAPSWNPAEATAKRKKVEAQEKADQEKETGAEEDILSQIENM